MKKSELLMDVIYVFFLLFSPHRLSFMSVIFDFNDLPSDVAPVSPILFTVYVKRKEKREFLMDFICVSFFCFHNSD